MRYGDKGMRTTKDLEMDRVSKGGVVLVVLTIISLTLTAASMEEAPEITVFAAASLTQAFGEIEGMYEEGGWGPVAMNFDGSQMLRTQIENGAIADVFASANEKHMDALQAEGFMDNSTVIPFLENKLAVIIPKDNPARIENLHDLSRPGIRIVIGTPEVPVGSYARQILDKLRADPEYGPDYADQVLDNVISEETTVNLVVSKIALGEADAGFAYTSDVSPQMAEKIQMLEIPDQFNVIARYYIGVLKGAEHPQEAGRFIDLVISPSGQDALKRHGFIPLTGSPESDSGPQVAETSSSS